MLIGRKARKRRNLKIKSGASSLKKLIRFIEPYKKRIYLAVGLAVMLNLLGQIPPWIQKFFIDEVVTDGRWDLLIGLALVMVTIPVVEYLTSLWNNFLITFVGQKLVFDIRRRMYERLMRLSLRYHEDTGTGAVISRLMGDTATIQNMVTWNTISLVNDFISFCIGIVVIFSLSWKLSLAIIAILPLHAINYFFFVRRIRIKTGRIRNKWDRIYNQVYERLKGARLVRAFGMESIESDRFVMETSNMMDLNMGNVALSSSFHGFAGLIDGLGNTIIFCFGCYLVIRGELTYGSVAAFMAYAWRVLGPVFQFSGISNQIEQTLVSADRIFKTIDTEPEIEDKEDAVILPPIKGDISFEHVVFEYEPRYN